jgi:hypothetical protein
MNYLNDGQYTAFVGIDWADTKHDICLHAADSNHQEFDCIPHQVDDIERWAQAPQLTKLYHAGNGVFWTT